jgi:hypothetical protein
MESISIEGRSAYLALIPKAGTHGERVQVTFEDAKNLTPSTKLLQLLQRLHIQRSTHVESLQLPADQVAPDLLERLRSDTKPVDGAVRLALNAEGKIYGPDLKTQADPKNGQVLIA